MLGLSKIWQGVISSSEKGMASVRGDLQVKRGTANLAEDYCFIHKALRPVFMARRQIAAVPPSNSRPGTIPATLIWPLQSIAGGCQSSEMAALLNSLSFAFANSFLPKYRVKYYDYIVKWCSGV